MLIAIFFLGNEIHFMEYTFKSLKTLLSGIGYNDYVTFSICNDEENIFTDKYIISYDFPSPVAGYNICSELMKEYERQHNVKFNTIFITRTNSLYNKVQSLIVKGHTNNSEISPIKHYISEGLNDIEKELNLGEWIRYRC
jgi:hypothetical protein